MVRRMDCHLLFIARMVKSFDRVVLWHAMWNSDASGPMSESIEKICHERDLNEEQKFLRGTRVLAVFLFST